MVPDSVGAGTVRRLGGLPTGGGPVLSVYLDLEAESLCTPGGRDAQLGSLLSEPGLRGAQTDIECVVAHGDWGVAVLGRHSSRLFRGGPSALSEFVEMSHANAQESADRELEQVVTGIVTADLERASAAEILDVISTVESRCACDGVDPGRDEPTRDEFTTNQGGHPCLEYSHAGIHSVS